MKVNFKVKLALVSVTGIFVKYFDFNVEGHCKME